MSERDEVAGQLMHVSMDIQEGIHNLLMDVIGYNLKFGSIYEIASSEDFKFTLQEVVALRLMSASIQRKLVSLVEERPCGGPSPGFPLLMSLMGKLSAIDEAHEDRAPLDFGFLQRVLDRVRITLRRDQESRRPPPSDRTNCYRRGSLSISRTTGALH